NCGKKHKRSDAGKPCSSCGETIIESKLVRRRKMGHIKLAAPVAHIWYSKVHYSAIKSILGLKQEELDSVLYFKTHIIFDDGGFAKFAKKGTIIPVQSAPSIYRKILAGIWKSTLNDKLKKEIKARIDQLVEESTSEIGKNYGIDFYEYNNFIARYSNIRIGTGAETIKKLLLDCDLQAEKIKIDNDIKKHPENNVLLRRHKVIESFIQSGQNPADMIFDVLPIIPADMRPLIQLDGGRHSTVDVNELYRRVLIRNNRLKKWLQIGAPDLITQNEKRMLQESVDALFDNTRKKVPVLSKDNRPLKSLAENLKGKQGRFRQNLLGKRVDYSGRSVICVGPELLLHQVGLPKQMIVKLFEPFIVNLLVKEGVTRSIKQAKKMIEVYDDRIWKYASRVIDGHPVLLNRAPTLHRLSVQAFEPIITSGKAIRLHPLVTPSFNADFDGDQMAVHVPLSKKAKQEARELMISTKNILGPKDGKLILSPSQDIVLGIYFLTKTAIKVSQNPRIIKSLNELDNLIITKNIHIHEPIAMLLTSFPQKFVEEIKQGYKYFITTVGRLLINRGLPKDFIYVNEISNDGLKSLPNFFLVKKVEDLKEHFKHLEQFLQPWKKGTIDKIIEAIYERNSEEIAQTLDNIKSLGFEYSMLSGTSMAMSDIIEIDNKEIVLSEADEKVARLKDLTEEGLITDDERYLKVLEVWAEAREKVKNSLESALEKVPNNPVYMMMNSGARGNISNFVQLAGMRGSMAKTTHEYAALKRHGIQVRSVEEIPIKSSFKSGLTPFEYFLSTHGARKGLSDTATKTAESGYLTRRLVDAVQDVMIVESDCKGTKGIFFKDIKDTRIDAVIESLEDRIIGRFAIDDIKIHSKVVISKEEPITVNQAKIIIDSGIDEVEIRSPLTCSSHRGICKKCFGIDLTSGKEVNIGEAVGIISAQSIGEPGTQLTMRTFHTGGVAGVSDITQGFNRLMELVDANKNPKSAAIIAKSPGKVTDIEIFNRNKLGDVVDYKIIIKGKKQTIQYVADTKQILRIKQGDDVIAGQKITEGSIRLQDLLDFAGPLPTQTYIIKEVQKLYRLQGINIADKYIEIIVKQMLSKYHVVDPGDSTLYGRQIVSKDLLYEVNKKLISEGKRPVIAKQAIIGVKPLPLQSESFLSSASYQRTAESLVTAAIEKKIDSLYGVKENLIVGNKIPVGTGVSVPQGKYDIFDEEFKIEEEYYNLQEGIDIELNTNSFDSDIRIINKEDSFEQT
ncbi:MAG: DNA-directed RNA polymerase subunit beta', partial [Mycoplasmataceae bacterium]|nr:DNA-directed RNA polymerase subunit beta' [Mycoplasmataceae bacterium]